MWDSAMELGMIFIHTLVLVVGATIGMAAYNLWIGDVVERVCHD